MILTQAADSMPELSELIAVSLQPTPNSPEPQAAKAAPKGTERAAKQSAQGTEDPAQTAVESAADDEGCLVAEMMKVDWKASMASSSLLCTRGHNPA